MGRALALALILSHAAGKADPDSRSPVDPKLSVDEVWKSRCGGCHKVDGAGKPDLPDKTKRVPDLRDAKWQEKHDDAAIRASIEDGIADTKMKAYRGKMSAEQLDGIVAKIRSFATKSP